MCLILWPICLIFCWQIYLWAMNIEEKPGANSLVRKFEWCYILHLFIYCWWVEWVNCWYLLEFTNFLHCRSIFYRSNFEGAPKARCLFDTEKLILVSQHNLMTWSSCVLKSDFQNHTSWREICKFIYPEVRFFKRKIISQTRDLRGTPWVQLLLLHVYGQKYGWYHTEQDWQYLFVILIMIVIVVMVVIPFVIGYQLSNVSR